MKTIYFYKRLWYNCRIAVLYPSAPDVPRKSKKQQASATKRYADEGKEYK